MLTLRLVRRVNDQVQSIQARAMDEPSEIDLKNVRLGKMNVWHD